MITPLSHARTEPSAKKTSDRKAPVGANYFGTQLSNAVKGATAGVVKGSIGASAQPTTPAKSASPSQNNVAAALFSLAAGPTSAVAAPPQTVGAPAPLTATQTAMGVLAQALQAAGISPQWLNMSAHDDYVSYPAGPGYMNHLISLTANGHDTNIDANLMMINPNVAVTEIRRLMTLA